MVGTVVSIQPGSDRLQCFIFCVIRFRKHFHRLPLEIRQGNIETIRGESSVERLIRWIENVRWSIVTVDTVHPPSRHAGDLRWCQWVPGKSVFRYIATLVLRLNPGNNLTSVITRDVVDLVRQIHMPVDPSYWSSLRTTATHINQQANLA